MEHEEKTKRCVYTALTGNYEELNEQPTRKKSDIDFICFTDNKYLKSNTWKIVPIDLAFPLDPQRSSKLIKICPHRFLKDYDISLYIDNSIRLILPPEQIFTDLFTNGYDLICFKHSFRETLMDEFSEVLKLRLDNPDRILEQLDSYLSIDPNILKGNVYCSGFLIRKHNEDSVINAMEDWLAQVYRYSRRDQLSLSFIFQTHAINFQALDLDIHQSKYHKWPTAKRFGQSTYLQPNYSALLMDEAVLNLQNNALLEYKDTATNISAREAATEATAKKLAEYEFELKEIKKSKAWKLALFFRGLRMRLFPQVSFRKKEKKWEKNRS